MESRHVAPHLRASITYRGRFKGTLNDTQEFLQTFNFGWLNERTI